MTAIQKRQYLERKERHRLLSWQTRTLAQYVATTVDHDSSKGPNPVMEAANDIVLDPIELKELQALRELETIKAPKAQTALGSYERMAGAFVQGFRQNDAYADGEIQVREVPEDEW